MGSESPLLSCAIIANSKLPMPRAILFGKNMVPDHLCNDAQPNLIVPAVMRNCKPYCWAPNPIGCLRTRQAWRALPDFSRRLRRANRDETVPTSQRRSRRLETKWQHLSHSVARGRPPRRESNDWAIIRRCRAVIRVAFGEGLVILSVERHYGWLRIHL